MHDFFLLILNQFAAMKFDMILVCSKAGFHRLCSSSSMPLFGVSLISN